MKIALTGSTGFIGKNLSAQLEYLPNVELIRLSRTTPLDLFEEAIKTSDLIVHLAGESRSREIGDAFLSNIRYTELITKLAEKKTRIIFSSTNKENHPLYWQAKQQEESLIKKHFINHTIVRMDNVFGKWAKPFYNSVIATFIHGIIESKPFQLFDELSPIDFLYIDDVVKLFIELIFHPNPQALVIWKGHIQVHAKGLLEMIQTIHQDYQSGLYITYKNPFLQQLALTYLSYLPKNQLVQTSNQYPDQRGSLIELTKHEISGQSSLNLIHPGFIKGNHFHHQRWEKFMIISGQGVVKLRQKFNDNVLLFDAKEVLFKMITIPPGYIHSIENTGKENMLVWMWSSLVYDPQYPDTYSEKI